VNCFFSTSQDKKNSGNQEYSRIKGKKIEIGGTKFWETDVR